MLLRTPILLVVSLAISGCGNVESTPDATVVADAGIDAAPAPAKHRYVIDRLVVPRQTSSDVRLDIDGDGDTENRLARLLELFEMQTARELAFVLQRDVDRGIDRGQVVLLAEIEALSLDTTASARFRTLEGATPVPAPCAGDVCGGHLAGGATFTISPASPASSRVDGAIVGGRLVGSNGALVLKIPASADRNVTFALSAARIELGEVSESGIRNGVIGGAMRPADFEMEFVPLVHAAIRAEVAASCTGAVPPCNCMAGSAGRDWQTLFDEAPEDCQVSETEVRTSPLIKALFTADVDVAPVDGMADSMSVVFGITAVPAVWSDAP